MPTIWNRIFIGCNAVVLGPIPVGDESTIGAGAVVTKDVLANRVVVGVLARIVKKRLGLPGSVGSK